MTSDTTSEAESSGHSVVVDIDLWVFVALLCSCAMINVREHVKVPLSALLMLAGLVLRIGGQYIGMLGNAVKVVDGIEAETILLIFLPTLIFECAFSTDWYTFKREIGQILLLASTAVVVASILTAVVIREVLGFHSVFGWYAALMLGAILSATDHVAVVSQLKEVNADNKLETLIQGETLVNEGSVIVIFTAMMKGAVESAAKSEEIISLFFRLTLGGIAVGLGFGLAVSFWLKRLFDNPVVETLLTVITTYLLFFVSDETKMHVSGAIGIVTYGLYMSAYGITLISHSVEEKVHKFWELIGTCIESLILVLGGMLMGLFFTDFKSLEYTDIGALVALFVLLHAVRAVTIVIHWPLLRMMGYGCTCKEMIVLIVGALKGTISIALALIVFHREEFSERLRDLVMFWSVGVSALSATFDSMILHYVVKALGLESMTKVEENMLVSVTASILETASKEMEVMKEDEEYNMVNWESVMKTAGPETLFFNMLRATQNGRRLMKKKLGQTTKDILEQFSNLVKISDEDIILETRRRFFSTLKGLYWDKFEKGQCFGPSVLKLIESANRGLDSEGEVMHDWRYLEAKVFPVKILRVIRTLARVPLLGRFFKTLEYAYITEAYDICRNFIRAHTEAEELLDEMEIDIKEELFEEVMKEPQLQVILAKEFLSAHIMDVYPEVCVFVQTKEACYSLLTSERDAIMDAYEEGVITELEHSELMSSVNRSIEEMLSHNTPKVPTLIEMLRACYLFSEMPTEKLQEMAHGLKEETFTRGKVLFEDHEDIKGIYIVLKGRLRETSSHFQEELYPGDVVGAQYLLPHFTRTETSVHAAITSNVAFVSLDDIKSFAKEPEFERKVWMLGAKKAIKMCKSQFGQLSTLDTAGLNVIFTNCNLCKYSEGDIVPLDNGLILLEGQLSNGTTEFAYIPGEEGQALGVSQPSVILHFTEQFGTYLRSSTHSLKKMITKFDIQERSPQIRISGKAAQEARRASTSFGLNSPIPRGSKSRITPMSIESEDSKSLEILRQDESSSTVNKTPDLSTMLGRIRQSRGRLGVESVNQASEKEEDDAGELLRSSERAIRSRRRP